MSGHTLAPRAVREAAQYRTDQGAVWASVAQENARRGKQSVSGTLMATLDDREVKETSEKVARDVTRHLETLAGWPQVVGIAYAIGEDTWTAGTHPALHAGRACPKVRC